MGKAPIPMAILLLGIALRVAYAFLFGFEYYAHDLPGHMDYVKYFSHNVSLPDPENSLEFPQQPLYYIIAGFAHRLLSGSMEDRNAWNWIVWISAVSSIGFVLFAYAFSKKASPSIWVQSAIVGTAAFTPSFLFQAGRISNDPLLSFFSAGFFVFLLSFIKSDKAKDMLYAIILALLAAFTKISGGILLLLAAFALTFGKYPKVSKKIRTRLTMLAVISGLACLSFFVWRAYIPSDGNFRFVNSAAYEGQVTTPYKASYYLSFNLEDFFNEGQSHVFGNRKISNSLFTYLYGTFLFGEFEHKNDFHKMAGGKLLMQTVIIFGLVFPAGLALNMLFIKKWEFIEWLSALTAAATLASLASFFLKYNCVCNSDFRYLTPAFLPITFLYVSGIFRLAEKFKTRILRTVTLAIPMVFIFLEFAWDAARIYLKISANI